MKNLKILLIVFLNIVLFNCAAKKAYYNPYVEEPNALLTKPARQTFDDSKKYSNAKKDYYKKKHILKKEWNYYKNALKYISKERYNKSKKYFDKLINYHNKNKQTIKFEEYYYGAIYYKAIVLELEYNFDDALKELNKITDENSFFYNKALIEIKKIINDSDGDGYSDVLESIEGFNPENPYSHP